LKRLANKQQRKSDSSLKSLLRKAFLISPIFILALDKTNPSMATYWGLLRLKLEERITSSSSLRDPQMGYVSRVGDHLAEL
jgi:hypothetical protein